MDVRRCRGSMLDLEAGEGASPEGPLLVALLGDGDGGAEGWPKPRRRRKPKALARQTWDSSPLVTLPGDAPRAEEARQRAEERMEARKLAAAAPRGRETSTAWRKEPARRAADKNTSPPWNAGRAKAPDEAELARMR